MKPKKLAQVLAHGLNGKPSSKWMYLMSERVNWMEPRGMRKPLICMFQELLDELLFGKDAFQKQQEALEDGLIKIPNDQLLRLLVDQFFFASNRKLAYLGTDGKL